MKKAETGKIRDYLLGRVADERELAELEERFFEDPDFADAVAVVREDLVNRYVLGEITGAELADFERAAAASSELRGDIKLARELRRIANKAPEPAPGMLASILALLRRPAYGIGFAAFVLLMIAGAYLILRQGDHPDSLAAVYEKERPVESRLADFNYAPLAVTRGTTDDRLANRLRIIENGLLMAVDNDPSVRNNQRLAAFYITQRRFDDAIRILEKIEASGGADKSVLNDLGTAFLEKGIAADTATRAGLLTTANERFAGALQLDPDFLPALFNRALCLGELGLRGEAKTAWERYLVKDPKSGWADEARRRLEKLATAPRVSENRDVVLSRFLDAFRARDEAAEWRLISETRELVSGVWLPDQLGRRFLDAAARGDDAAAEESMAALKRIGELEKSRNADFFVSAIAAEFARADEKRLAGLRDAKAALTLAYKDSTNGDNARAKAGFGKAADAFRAAGADTEALIADHWIAFSDLSLKNVRAGRDGFERIARTAANRSFRWLGGIVRYRISAVLYFEDRQWDSLQADLEAARIMKELGDVCGIRFVAADIAASYYGLGEFDKAIEELGPAIFPDAREYLSAKQTWRSRGDATFFLFRAGRLRTSLDFARESAASVPEEERQYLFDSLRNVALGQTAVAEYDEALATLARASGAANEIDDERTRELNLAQTALLEADILRLDGQSEAAIAKYDNAAVRLGRFPEVRSDEYRLRKGRLKAFRALGRTNEAKTELNAALALLERHGDEIESEDSRIRFLDGEHEISDAATEIALDEGDSNAAFAASERGKADSLRRNYGIAARKSATPVDYRGQIPAGAILIQYAVLPRRLGIWIISRDSHEFVERAVEAAELTRLTDEALTEITLRKSDAKTATLRLYEHLIGPVAGRLDRSKQIVFVPDKFLFRVPFAALWNGEKYLVEDFVLSIAPSAAVFVAQTVAADRRELVSNERVTAFGDPAFEVARYPKLARLSSAADEARDVARLYPGGNAILADSATRTRFLDSFGESDVVHFAGHYLPNSVAPDSSKFLLAGPDGDFRALEIARKPLSRLRLAVVSACDSSADRVFNGEGPVGASRAFIAAGVPVVVSAAWSIDSVATGRLMTDFHRIRTKEKLNSASALREAQILMLRGADERFRLPFYWAAFGATGAYAGF